MKDAKKKFLKAWSQLPEREHRYNALIRQIESLLGAEQPQTHQMSDGQRLVMTWTGLHDEQGGVLDDGRRIVFQKQRLHPATQVWEPVAPTLIAWLMSSPVQTRKPSESARAILRHGARQVKLEYVRGKWHVEGRGELSEDVFYETLMELLRLNREKPEKAETPD